MNTTTNYTRVQVPAIPVPSSNWLPTEAHDRSSSKPPGREPRDQGEKGPNNFMRCRKSTIISTFNARTLSKASRITELASCAKQQNIDIVSIQEHRFFHPANETEHKLIDGYQLITASAWKNSQRSTIGGVGLLLSPRAYANLMSVEKISPRILVAEFNSNPKTTVIACYSPTNVSKESLTNQYYQELKSITENIPAHNFLVIAGDFNAQVGPADALFTYNRDTNRNGEKLVDFSVEFHLTIVNTTFMKPANKLWTLQLPTGKRSQVDYILIRNKWRNSARNSQAYPSFSTVGSDHRVVSCTICLSLRAPKKPALDPMKQIDWKLVSATPAIATAFTLDVRNRFDVLSTPEDDIETAYNNMIISTQEVALATLPRKKKEKPTPLSAHAMVKKARAKLQATRALHQHRSTRSSLKSTNSAQKELDAAYASADAERIKDKINKISTQHDPHNQHITAWDIINELTGRKSKPSVRIKGGTADQRKDAWLSHFRNLLGDEPKTPANTVLPIIKITDSLNIPTTPFTLEEILPVIKSMKTNKSPGLDNIPTIIWKDPVFHGLLLKICNHCFSTLAPPSAWKKAGIIPVPKKGDLTITGNYRGISLIPIAAKIYNKLLLNRIEPAVDPLLRKNQNGFRKGRSTISQILALRRIIEEMRKHNKEVTLCFVDFTKAFDSISREVLFSILPRYGIPAAITNAIQALYTSTTASVLTPDGETAPFDISAGVLQGDTLAPFLFIIVLDYVLRISLDTINGKGLQLQPRQSRRFPAKHITDLDYADDLALVAETVADAESLLQSLETTAELVGLHCNERKTEYITTNPSPSELKSLSGTCIKRVDDFKYLGSFIMDSHKDFKHRKALAWTASNRLDKIWRSHLDNILKLRLFHTLIEPILLYGSETWTLTAKQLRRLDGTYTNLLRRVQNIHWTEHQPLDRIYGSIPPISQKLRRRRLQFAGHCQRAEGELVSTMLLWKPLRCPVRNRKLTYPDVIARDTGIPTPSLAAAMMDRDVWHHVVGNIPAVPADG